MQLKPTDGRDDTWIMLIFSDCECDDDPQAVFQAAQSGEGRQDCSNGEKILFNH